MSDEALNKAFDASIAGIERLSQTVEKLAPDAWDIAVRQQIIDGWGNLGLTITFLLLTFIFAHLTRKTIKKIKWYNGEPETPPDTLRLITSIVFGICFAVFAISSGAVLLFLLYRQALILKMYQLM